MEEPNPKNMSPEQIEELKEKIKNMTPEELKEFQKKQCIFCQIISGKVQAKKVYEDEKTIAILDINPANPGHVLLLPKEHYTVMPQLPAEDIAHISIVAKFLSNAPYCFMGSFNFNNGTGAQNVLCRQRSWENHMGTVNAVFNRQQY